MINLKLIYKALGSLLFIEAFMMLLCLAMALFYGEDDVLGFTMAIILIVMTAFVLKFNGRASTNSMNRRDAYLLVTLTWIVFSLFGALPFVISGYIPSFTNAYFETMSGFTTTGATILDNVEALPHGLIFWRSMKSWDVSCSLSVLWIPPRTP